MLNFYAMGAGFFAAVGLVWWLQRWHGRQSQYSPHSWTHRMARKAWRDQ
jgi:hypothetical protein